MATSSASKETTTYTGSCSCGTVQYELTGQPLTAVLCHCDHCRKSSGSSFMANSIYPKSSFHLTTGAPSLKTFINTTTDSGNPTHRSFCSDCGSPLFTTNPKTAPDAIFVSTGTIDHLPDEWRPRQQLFTKRRVKWLPEIERCEGFEGMVVGGEGEGEG